MVGMVWSESRVLKGQLERTETLGQLVFRELKETRVLLVSLDLGVREASREMLGSLEQLEVPVLMVPEARQGRQELMGQMVLLELQEHQALKDREEIPVPLVLLVVQARAVLLGSLEVLDPLVQMAGQEPAAQRAREGCLVLQADQGKTEKLDQPALLARAA